jgi:hypothetical protein
MTDAGWLLGGTEKSAAWDNKEEAGGFSPASGQRCCKYFLMVKKPLNSFF